jgi:hypothetical protein
MPRKENYEMKSCEHCREMVPALNLSIHYEICPELTDECPHCEERFPRIIMGDHILVVHQGRNPTEELNRGRQPQQPVRDNAPGQRPWMFQNNGSEILNPFGTRPDPLQSLFQLINSGTMLESRDNSRNRNEEGVFFSLESGKMKTI